MEKKRSWRDTRQRHNPFIRLSNQQLKECLTEKPSEAYCLLPGSEVNLFSLLSTLTPLSHSSLFDSLKYPTFTNRSNLFIYALLRRRDGNVRSAQRLLNWLEIDFANPPPHQLGSFLFPPLYIYVLTIF